jgi:hypothetical protein
MMQFLRPKTRKVHYSALFGGGKLRNSGCELEKSVARVERMGVGLQAEARATFRAKSFISTTIDHRSL